MSVQASSSDTDQDPLRTPLLRAEQVAELLAVRPSTVFELSRRRNDPLPSVRIGRSKRFSHAAVAAWVEAQSST